MKFCVITVIIFQIVRHIVDVYRSKIPVQKKTPKGIFLGILTGTFRLIIGLIKIALLAKYSGKTVSILLEGNLSVLSASGAWLGIFLFSVYIYFQLSGCSDIVIGLAEIFGFHYKENFNYPYTARGVRGYWDRWNISLSSLLNEYIWEPMNKKWNFSYINTLIVCCLTGLCYGIGLNFLLWGVYFSILLMIERKLSNIDVDITNTPIISNIVTMLAVIFGWGIFYYKNISDYGMFLEALFGVNNRNINLTVSEAAAVHEIFWLIPAFAIACTPLLSQIGHKLLEKCKWFVYSVQLVCIVIVFVLGIVFYAPTNNAYVKQQITYVVDYCKEIIKNDNIIKIAEHREKEKKVQVTKEPVKQPIQQPKNEKNENKKDIASKYKNTGEYIILEDKALQLFHYDADNAKYALETYNSIMDSLSEKINKYLLIAPMKICFEDEKYQSYGDNLKNVIDEIYTNISQDVTTINAYRYLDYHKDERIFLNTDYYWTALGAYYGAKAFCDGSGRQIKSIEQYEVRSFKGYIGAFSYIKEGKALTKYPENVDYYLHKGVSNTQTVYKYDDNKKLITYNAPAIALSRRGYNIFLGAGTALSVIDGDVKNEKVLMIMGDSYVRAFAPWLIPNYEKVIVLNPQYFKGRKPEFQQLMKKYNVTEFMILEYGNDICSKFHIEELRKTCIYKE